MPEPSPPSVAARAQAGRRSWVRKACIAGVAAIAAGGIVLEMRTSVLQSLLLVSRAQNMTYGLAEGSVAPAAFPHSGPYDQRLGYKALPDFIGQLQGAGFAVARQAQASAALAEYIDSNGHAIYREKDSAGLTVLDRNETPLYSQRMPLRVFERYEEVPELLAQTLLFIEDRKLFDEAASRNPAVDWPRFIGAALYRLPPGLEGGGGASTLATQIEKLRHSPGGLTQGPLDKLRQMRAASLRAYLDGRDTRAMRRQILATYLNTTPLGSRAGVGEIIGLGDAMWTWYGSDFRELSQMLAEPPGDAGQQRRRGLLYKQALSLLAAQRRPAFYLGERRNQVLPERTHFLLQRLHEAGIIDPALYQAALEAPLEFLQRPPPSLKYPLWQRKAADGLRVRLMTLLGLPSLYTLDRIDLVAHSTIDARAQAQVANALARLTGRDGKRAAAPELMGPGAPENLVYSVLLYERVGSHNLLRLRADSLNAPLDLNSGSRLDLGSTAKLRTLITYLEVIAELHGRLAVKTAAQLQAEAAGSHDALTRWAAGYLQMQRDRSLAVMLEAALQRRYSASPHQVFFTGGGEHVFGNFRREEDNWVPTVEHAFEHSVNLSFIRIMSDIVQYHVASAGVDVYRLLSDRSHPDRGSYLKRFADREGRHYLERFYADFRGRTPDQILHDQLRQCAGKPRRAMIVFRTLRPEAGIAEFEYAMSQALPRERLDARRVRQHFLAYDPARWSLDDRAQLAHLHPLKLWLAAYLQGDPGASRAKFLNASTGQRQSAYRWLLRTRNSVAQNQRILSMLEEDAFTAIGERWQRLGYPFARLVPSLATAIGSSGDRPDALAALMGIVLNQGQRLPSVDIAALQFAGGTPYETWMAPATAPPQQVLAPEVAAAARRLLAGVVSEGTGQRLRGGFQDARGEFLPVGGKTGTSDQRTRIFDERARLIAERPVNRTAAFVFFIGDRFFGTITACVLGPQSAGYEFNSSFAVQLLRDFSPHLQPLVQPPAMAGEGRAAAG